MSGEMYFWLGASADPTGLGSSKEPEPDKQSPPYGCHPSRCQHRYATTFYPVSGEWLKSCYMCGAPA